MIIGIPKEIMHEEARVAATPDTVKKYVADGHTVLVEKNAGAGALHFDADYAAAGAVMCETAQEVYDKAELILKVKEPQWEPDFGGPTIHPTAGTVAVGCRMPLVAFNINLNTPDISIASAIAKIIRQSSGGLACVKALGVMLEDRNIAQVSINMTNLHKTPLYRVVELVKAEAKRWGVTVIGTEVVGLTPMHALIDAAEYYLQIENFDGEKQVLENYLL